MKRSLASAIGWSCSATWADRAFSALFNVVFAALLGPRDFGIVAIAIVYVAFIQMFLEQGLATALIQRPTLQLKHLDTVFWVNMLSGLVLAGISVLFSGWWANVNHLPGLTRIIAALSMSVPIQGMTIVQFALLQREMNFKKLAVRSNISVLIGGGVGIAMAFRGMGVFSLVAQQIVKEFTALILLWRVSSWRPGFRFSWKYLSELLGFSIPTFAVRLANFADAQAGVVLLGAVVGPAAVGLYRLADRLTGTLLSATTGAVQTVSLPEFSRHQNDQPQLRDSVLTCLRVSATLTLPAMAGMACISDSLMAALGPQWLPASGVLKLLSILGMILSFTTYTGPLLQALAKPRPLAVLIWTRTIVGLGCLVIAGYIVQGGTVNQQVMGVTLARFTFGAFIATPFFLYILLRLAKISFRELGAPLIPSVCSAISIAVSTLTLSHTDSLAHLAPIVSLIVQMAVGGMCGIATLCALDPQVRRTVRKGLSWRYSLELAASAELEQEQIPR